MKRMRVYLLALIAAAGLFACSDDEGFGKLEYEGTTSYTVEVHRDTADVYKISLPIVSEKGLSKITLVDATGKALDEKTSFSNPKSYTYEYDFDLTPYTQNSAFMLTLNITDVDGQAVKQSITINVKKFSELDIRFAFEGVLISLFEDCNLKFTVKRGMIPLKEVQVYVGAELSSEYDLSLDPTKAQYDLNLSIKGLKMGNNDVKIVVTDSKEQKFEKTVTVKRDVAKSFKDMNRIVMPSRFQVKINNNLMDGSGDVPADGRLYRLIVDLNGATGDSKYLEFAYDGDNVSRMDYLHYGIDDNWDIYLKNKTSYNYIYSTDGELIKVTKKLDLAAAVDYITDIVYELGNIKSYKIDGKSITTNYLEKDGEMIRVDYLDGDMSGYTYGLKNRNNNNPMYIAALPAVVPGVFDGFELNILYNRYLFDTLNNKDNVVYSYAIGDMVDMGGGWSSQTITWKDGGVDKSMQYQYQDKN